MSPDSGPIRVLLVDDHPMIRIGVAQLLNGESGIAVCGECKNAEEALPLAVSDVADVVVVDISLERSSGLNLIRDIKKARKSARILVYSMHDELLYGPRAVQAGALGYVCKSAHPSELVEAVRGVARGRLSVSPRVAEALLANITQIESQGGQDPVETLSNRELQVFELLGQGLTMAQIAEQLHRSVKTIETHRERIMKKLGIANAAELMRRAVEWAIGHHRRTGTENEGPEPEAS